MNLFKEGLTSIIRKLLVLAFAWLMVPLINHQWLTSDFGKKVESSIDNWAGILAITVIGFLGPIVWGVWNKIVAKAKIIIAAYTHSEDAKRDLGIVERETDKLTRPEKFRLATSPGTTPVP